MKFFWQRDRPELNERARAGEWGEKEAERFLRGKGYTILGRRVRFGPREEIDLVACDGDVLVFVEVKTRRREDFGRPGSAVNKGKRRVLSRAAIHYLRRRGYPAVSFRFDVVEVVGHPGGGTADIRHIEQAFPLDSRYRVP